jgi:hypothetical protein
MALVTGFVAREDWNREAAAFQDHNYQQTWSWAEAMARRNGALCEHVAIRSGSQTLGLAAVRIKKAAGVGVAYVRGGPITRSDSADHGARLEQVLHGLAEEYVVRRGLVLRILAPLGPPESNGDACAAFERSGFVPTDRSKAYRTRVMRIDRPLEEIRLSLSRNWRNNLSRGLRKNLELATGTDDALFEPLCGLHSDLLERKGFGVDLDADFYRAVQREHSGPEKFHVLNATLDGQVVSSLLVSMHGDSWIGLIGATHASGAKIYAAYYLFWKAVEMARDRGMRWFDLGGIDPEGNPGVYNFKKGMGGQEMSAPGPFELVPGGVRGQAAVFAEDLYRRLLEWKSRG